jgi:curli biogenesis system outer membrane secretion channel CsgG
MRSLVRLSAIAASLAVLLTAPMAAQTSRPSVALLDFDFSSIEHWWSGNQDIGKGIADLIVDALVDDGSFRVFERKKLDTVLGEQNFNASDRVDPSAKAAQIGKAIGVKYLIAGSVTKFGTEDSSKGVGGGGFGSKFGLGAVGTKSGKASVAISLRVIDTSTGELVAVAKGEGTSKRNGLLLGGAAGGGGKAGVGELNFGSSNFHDTILGEATEAAVKDTVTKLLAKKDHIK